MFYMNTCDYMRIQFYVVRVCVVGEGLGGFSVVRMFTVQVLFKIFYVTDNQ